MTFLNIFRRKDSVDSSKRSEKERVDDIEQGVRLLESKVRVLRAQRKAIQRGN